MSPKLHAVFIIFALSSEFGPRANPLRLLNFVAAVDTRRFSPFHPPAAVAEIAATADLCYVQEHVCQSVRACPPAVTARPSHSCCHHKRCCCQIRNIVSPVRTLT